MWLLPQVLGLQAFAQAPGEETLFTIAVQAYQDGLLEPARDQLQKYLATYPQGKRLAEVHYLLGDYFYRKGDDARAVEYLQKALQLQPEAPFRDDARYLLGRSHFENGRYHEAVQALQPLIEQGRTGRWYEAALYWTGEAWLSARDFDGATRTLQRLVEQFPTSEYLENALYSLGYVWQNVDAHEQALHAFQRVMQSFPQSKVRRSAAYGVARALVSLQRYEAAALHWEDLRTEAQSSEQAEEATFWWAESWAQAGRCEHARPAFQAYLEQFPQGRQRADALAVIGECAHAAGEFGEAIARFEALLQGSPAYPRREAVLLRLADAYYQEGRPAKAQEIYTRWLQSFPNSSRRVEILTRRGLLSHLQEDYIRSGQDFAEVLRLTRDPSQQILAHRMLGESYFRRNDCAAAFSHLSAVIKAGGPEAGGQGSVSPSPELGEAPAQQARFRRGLCAYRNQQYVAAVQDLSPLAEDPDFRGDRQALLLLLGHGLAALDRHPEAVVRYRQVLATGLAEEASAEVLASLGASLLKVGQVEEALTVYEQLLTTAPSLSGKERLHLQLGILYREHHAWEQAKRHLRAAAAGGEQAVSAEALYHLADLLLQEGAAKEGRVLLQKLTTQFTSHARWVGIAHYRLALSYEEDQGWPEAWEAYVAAADTATDPKLVKAARGRAKHLEETVDVHSRRETAE
ncbi:MAG: tetratricopeptide repeat protein [Nitrospinae bacterium]|nr:tetratricopeptide repeat protein [Nitrospinota bacterium]